MMKKLTAIILIAMVFTLSACETMKGLGEDIQKAGKALEKKASKSGEN
jgi:predicted small secreted protein